MGDVNCSASSLHKWITKKGLGQSIMGRGGWSVCVCVCVCVRERERDSKNRDIFLPTLYASSQIMPQFSQTSGGKLFHWQRGSRSLFFWKSSFGCSAAHHSTNSHRRRSASPGSGSYKAEKTPSWNLSPIGYYLVLKRPVH